MNYNVSILKVRACAKFHKSLKTLKQSMRRKWDRLSSENLISSHVWTYVSSPEEATLKLAEYITTEGSLIVQFVKFSLFDKILL